MLKLTIDNSTCRLEGLSPTQFKQLKPLMSYSIDPQAAYFSGSFKATRSLLTPRGEFPTGLLYIVRAFLLKEYRLFNLYETKDLRKRPKSTPGMFKLDLKA